MKFHYALLLALIAIACALGCTTTTGTNGTCSVTELQDLLPEDDQDDYRLVSYSSQLGSDFFRVLFQNETTKTPPIRRGMLASYNSTLIPGAEMNILVIEFYNPASAQQAAYGLQNTISSYSTEMNSTHTSDFIGNGITYHAVRIDNLTNTNGVGFYQEFVFWSVQQYTFMTKLTTADVGQDPRSVVVRFTDEMANICH